MARFNDSIQRLVFTGILVASVGAVHAAGGGGVLSDPNAAKGVHFDEKGKLPSDSTLSVIESLRGSLPFEDDRDIEEAQRGFIAAPEYKQIMAKAGNVAWDMESYEWLPGGHDFDAIHPSLQRQAILNMGYGLFEVMPDKIYQVRGYDLANITFNRGDTGWIVFDPLTAKETAAATLAFINEQLGASRSRRRLFPFACRSLRRCARRR